MKKFLTIVGLLTVFATPAFAQAVDDYNIGTGNVTPFAYQSTTQNTQSIDRAKGTNAFAMSPRANGTLDPYSPALNGGGSEGYNWSLTHDLN
jgi:opacity protein-like surface antigen